MADKSLFNSKVTDRKQGAFRDWKEDDEQAEIFLPLPANTSKKELAVVLTAEALHVRHTRLQKTLLRAEPLAGLVNTEESTWYLQGSSLLILVLAKQTIGETKSDRYWGKSLAAEDGVFECYKAPDDVAHAREARERLEAKAEAARKERVTASERALREKEQEEERAQAKAQRRRRAMEEQEKQLAEEDAARGGAAGSSTHRMRSEPEPWYGDLSWLLWGSVLAAAMILFDVLLHWDRYGPFFFPPDRPTTRVEHVVSPDRVDGAGDAWYEKPE